jgi:hypothetical protein
MRADGVVEPDHVAEDDGDLTALGDVLVLWPVSGGMSNSRREASTSLPMGDNCLPVPE